MTSSIRLSQLQQKVVEHAEGPLLVVAGPGSGKTRVLTERVRRLLQWEGSHFRVLALTFTNKAANEMSERLEDLGDLRSRAFIGTIHGFCLDLLSDRGKPLGFTGPPQIFEHYSDRRQVLAEAAKSDPELSEALDTAGDSKARGQLLDGWLRAVGTLKAHPVTMDASNDPLLERVLDSYNGGLRASGALDFDDLLIFGYRLLTEYPKIGDFYRRLYRFICIDEAQDLNEAQYCVIRALCGEDFDNVMMVGDPKQSIFGFNTSSPRFMEMFRDEFDAKYIELTDNFRSSRSIVSVAQTLQPSYEIVGQLPIKGEVSLIVGDDEKEEAEIIVNEIESLMRVGHEDIEGPVTPDRIAILGRTRYTLLGVEKELASRDIPYFRRVSSAHEFESYEMKEFLLGLRLLANPMDQFHFRSLAASWECKGEKWVRASSAEEVSQLILRLARSAADSRCLAVAEAIDKVASSTERLDIQAAAQTLKTHADTLPEEARGSVYEDVEVLIKEWDGYLRSSRRSSRSIAAFMSSMALGATQSANMDGVALLTVHASKGMEFDVVFVVGMAEGVFPDFRARGDKRASSEEQRNAFVAATRSRRLLYFSYPKTRKMPWGDIWDAQPSRFLSLMDLTSAG